MVLEMNTRSKYLNNHGYTLIEIVMVIVILGIIGAFTFQIVAAGVQAFKKSSARKDLYDQGRLALERMVRELRDAKEVTGSASSSITFKKAHPAQAADNTEEIKFQINGTNLERVGDPSGTPVTAVLASNVSSFQVTEEGSTGVSGGVCSISFDAASSSYSTASPLSWSHAIDSGSNRLLVVSIGVEGSFPTDSDVTGVTYDGVTLTKAVDHYVGIQNTEIWYLLEAGLPAAGSYTLQVTIAGNPTSINAGAISVSGAAQSSPEATASNDDGQSGSSTIQTNITTVTNGALVFDCVGSGNAISGFTADAGQTERFDVVGNSSAAAGSTELVATAGSATLGWTADSASNRLSHVLAAFGPAGGCSGAGGGANNLVMVTGDGTTNAADDAAKKVLFESWGWTVTSIRDSDGDYAGAAANNEVMYISESSGSGDVGTQATNLDIGIVVEEDYCWDEMEFGSVGNGGESGDSITITDNSHYITSPFATGSLTIYTAADAVGSLPSSLASGGQLLGTENVAGDPTLFVFDTGTALDNGTAANRRVGIPSRTSNPTNWNNDLKTIIQRSLDWAAGVGFTNVVTLELSLQDPNDSGNTVSMRTKVYLRNLP
jgi:prepilin-type N-terminal cleavage/methylation domain-containing protein